MPDIFPRKFAAPENLIPEILQCSQMFQLSVDNNDLRNVHKTFICQTMTIHNGHEIAE